MTNSNISRRQSGVWNPQTLIRGTGSSEGSGSDLALPRIPWEGGPNYWSQFSKAAASGWTDPTFFPISVYLSKPSQAAVLRDAGINLMMGAEHDGSTIASMTSTGMHVMPQQEEWTPTEVGNDVRAVAWFISDEIEMGMIPSAGADQFDWLTTQTNWVNTLRARNDGRFMHANFGNGILRTFWSTGTSPTRPGRTVMHDHVNLLDSSSADKYTYTSPDVAQIIDGYHDAPDWPNGTPVQRAYSYGWQADQIRRFQETNALKPVWTFIETARPYINEAGAGTITLDQIEGAVWSALIHEARGIAYFQHNNDSAYAGNYSIVDSSTIRAKVTAINAKVRSLAPVLNTQSYYTGTRIVNGFTYYQYSFGNNTDAMVKTYGGYCYIFAGLGMGHATGSKTFTVPAGVAGTTVEVVGESRTIPISGAAFSDTFASEWSHHVYRIPMGA